MNQPSLQLLLPKLGLDELITYHVKKQETFQSKDTEHPPFLREYSIELKKIEENLYEVFYPQGLLLASKSFQKLEPYFSELNFDKNSILYFSMDEDDEIQLKNIHFLKTTLLKNLKKLLSKVQEKEELELIKIIAENHDSEKNFEESILEDMEYIFYYHGQEKEDNCFVDYMPPETKLEAVANKALKRIGVGLSAIDLARFDFVENLGFKVQSLSGIDTLSETRHDFEKIRVAFLSGKLDFDAYQDICLHFKTHLFDEDNILDKFVFRSKIDSENIRRVREVEIVREVGS